MRRRGHLWSQRNCRDWTGFGLFGGSLRCGKRPILRLIGMPDIYVIADFRPAGKKSGKIEAKPLWGGRPWFQRRHVAYVLD